MCFFDPASPITNNAISGNGEEDVKTESASLSLLSGIHAAADEPSAGAVFARSAAVVSEYDRGADEHLQLDGRLRAIVDIAAADAGTPAASGGDSEFEPRAQRVEVRRRRDADLGLQLLPVAVWRRVSCTTTSTVDPFTFVPHAWGAGADAAAGVGA